MTDDKELHVISVLDHLALLQMAIGGSLSRIALLDTCVSVHGEMDHRRYGHEIWVSSWIEAHHVDGRDIVYWLDIVWRGSTWHLVHRISIQGEGNIWNPDEIVSASFDEIAQLASAGIREGLGMFETMFS